MRSIIILFLIEYAQSLGVCVQQTTYEECIKVKEEQCKWNGQFCKWSNNYLFGCDLTLSEKLCTKQIGKLDGTTAMCIFDKNCHTIYEQYFLNCSDKLSKSGCLSVTNPDQLCKWEDEQCKYLNQTEFNNINTIFQNLELSASVCSRITGFLIIHHSLLWTLLDYSPDVVSEAQIKVQIEAGVEFSESRIYQDTSLNDNFVDSNGMFMWYTSSTKLSISDTKLNDFQRYGCIAQEVLNENRFMKLFSLNGTIRGVNHVYCKYLNVNPTNPIFTVFAKQECLPTTQDELSDQSYINKQQLQCQDLSGLVCQRFRSSEIKCLVDYTQEFQCANTDTILETDECKTLSGIATHYNCATVTQQYCYLDISTSKGQCSTQCSNLTSKSACESNSFCRWLGSNLGNLSDSKLSKFIVCVPQSGCNQIGMNKKYCQQMSMNCYWNDSIQKCEEVKYIEQLRCEDCNSIFCCSSVSVYDQFCIWNFGECLNVKDQNLFSHYQSFSSSIIMNYNLCMSQKGLYNYYDMVTRTCKSENINLYLPCVDFQDQDYDLDNMPCNNGINGRINRELCFALINSNTKWDASLQRCVHVTNKSISCDSMQFVNPNLCKYGIVQESQICLYNPDTSSCYSSSLIDLSCETPGINQEQCVSNEKENCQWKENKCISLKVSLIVQYYCNEFQKVSPNVCRFTSQDFSCKYDFNTFGCSILSDHEDNCHSYINNQGCFDSAGQCYFDNVQNRCMDAVNSLDILKCDSEFISYHTCISITTLNQNCFWGSIPSDPKVKCRSYKQQFQTTCYSYQFTSNLNACTQMASNLSLTLTDDQFCEVIDQQCVQSTSSISDADCGYNRMINIHRCVAYTTQNCYFSNNKCNLIIGPSDYQQQLLGVLECHQSNLQICNQIVTPSQTCHIAQDKKCVQLYLSFSDSCQNLSNYDMQYYNPQICHKAIDACYYDVQSKTCKSPLSSDQFKCNQIGASKVLCLLYTFENCVFIDEVCRNLVDLNVECKYRNRNACFQGVKNCYWNNLNSACELYFSDCPEKFDESFSWQICQSSNYSCGVGKNGCISYVSNVPCWLSVSFELCRYQFQYCQWLDNQCVMQDYDCEEAQTIQQCLQHRSKFCVFHQNRCFTVLDTQLYECDQFDQVSQNFCRQYQPICTYSASTFECFKMNFLTNSQMVDLIFSQSYTCSAFSQDVYGCIMQRAIQCSYFNYSWYQFCGTSNKRLICDQFDQIEYPSILTCESISNCKFGMTTKGEPFCYTFPLQCENLNTFCFKDIPGLHCYQDFGSDQCQTYNQPLRCENVQYYNVNKQLCLSVMQNPENTSECYYQEETKMCKLKYAISMIIGIDIIYDYYFCLFQDQDYYLFYNENSDFEYCSLEPLSNLQNLNHYGCTKLQGDQYFFDLKQLECSKEISQPYIQISLCLQMNQQACLQVQNNLSCVWANEKCHKYINEFINVPCENRNYNSCLKSKNQKCIWIQNTSQCVEEDNQCQNSQCEYSESYCISIGKLWNNNYCYEYSKDLSISFFRCDQLGLSRTLCLKNTQSLTCYWNGYVCLEANLYSQKCQDDISQVTCNQIKTPKQICKWNNQACENLYNSYECNDFSTLSYCRQALISCQYNSSLQKCEQKLENAQKCSDTLSYKACQNVEFDYCQFDGYCNIWYRTRYSCENIVNYWGCMNTSMYCQWTGKCENIDRAFQPVACHQVPIEFNKVSCSKYSIEPCLYDEIHKKCDMKLTSSFTGSTSIDQTNYTQIRLIYECSQFTEKEDCVGSRIGYCEWQDNRCLNCQSNENCKNDSCSNKSLKQCLIMHNLFCAWRNDKCIDWVFDQQNFTQSLVTQICCKSMNSTVKYLESINSCVQIDIFTDQCNAYGLSKIACLSLVNKQCTFKDGQCVDYVFEYKLKCNQYNNVNQQACQQLPHLSCKYDAQFNACIDVDYSKDQCTTVGISQIGCSKIIKMPCYWNKQAQQCQNFQLQMYINQCDNETVANSYTCQLLNYHQDVCSYNLNKRTCQQQFNPLAKCSQPGLNRLACLRLVNQPCQYVNNQCQKIKSLVSSCNDLRDVNELTCKMNTNDHCIYDPVVGNCQYTLQSLPCNYKGLNINNCKLQQKCKWLHDLQQCACQIQQINSSCDLNESECKNNCIYEQELKICRPKKCFDLISCSGVMNGEYCYEDQSYQCQGAQKCEDILNLNESKRCSDFMFNGSNCIQLESHCVSGNNLQEICLNSDCSNTSCKYDNFTCRPLICSDYLEEDQCFQISNCVYKNGQCQQIQTCSEIDDQSLCFRTKVNEKQCSWEIYEIYQTKYYCTNNQCHLYSNSPSLCNGNEINQYSCYMNEFEMCQSCEDITDPCQCSAGCSYSDGKCKSILCQNFNKEKECQNSYKCYWSSKDNLCRKFCRYLILEEDCQMLDYECHWNPYQYKCEDGVQIEINLSVTLSQIDQYTQLIGQFILILILFQ
ncbi:unnamed protein product [Paramecium octaurelia]|uniref:Transmembrane protein n=1 Tax=Paramecium octaurelia TaxID=43137 RepID=A0A8S1SN48_PAROT|nr:unnamed protein product [Paramecium octaurelia]